MATLRIERPEQMPRATEHIPEMIALIERLTARGHTYTADGSVYFRIASFPEYGRLARLDVAGIQAGARVDTDKYDKENARDFVLWKFKSDEPPWAQWDAPFGRGRPGWHIECSAMSMKYLGETFDLHAGGEDLVFPHHENEIAQSQCGTGKLFARHWMHAKHLLIDNETMSKSKGNFLTIPDLRGRGPLGRRRSATCSRARTTGSRSTSAARACTTRRRRSSGCTASCARLDEVTGEGPEGPAAALCEQARERLRRGARRRPQHARGARRGARARDPGQRPAGGGLADARGRRARARPRSPRWTRSSACCCRAAGRTSSRAEEQALFDERQLARKQREFARADAARARLEALGVVLEDTPQGTRWRRRR